MCPPLNAKRKTTLVINEKMKKPTTCVVRGAMMNIVAIASIDGEMMSHVDGSLKGAHNSD